MSSYQDTLVVIGGIVLFAFLVVIGVLVVTQIGDAIKPAFSSQSRVGDMVDSYTDGLPKLFDWLFTIVFIALPLIGFGLGVMVRVSPVWYWVYVALALPVLFFGVFLRDLWEVFTTPTVIGDAASTLPVLDFIMSHYVLYSAFVFFVLGVGTYVKLRGLEVFGGGF